MGNETTEFDRLIIFVSCTSKKKPSIKSDSNKLLISCLLFFFSFGHCHNYLKNRNATHYVSFSGNNKYLIEIFCKCSYTENVERRKKKILSRYISNAGEMISDPETFLKHKWKFQRTFFSGHCKYSPPKLFRKKGSESIQLINSKKGNVWTKITLRMRLQMRELFSDERFFLSQRC